MFQFICMFCPALLSILIERRIEKKELSTPAFVVKFGLYVLLIFICNAFVNLIYFKDASIVFVASTFTIGFSIKYTLVSVFFALLLPYFLLFLKKNIIIKTSVEFNETQIRSNKKIVTYIFKSIFLFLVLLAVFGVVWISNTLTTGYLNQFELPIVGINLYLLTSFIIQCITPALLVIFFILIALRIFDGMIYRVEMCLFDVKANIYLYPYHVINIVFLSLPFAILLPFIIQFYSVSKSIKISTNHTIGILSISSSYGFNITDVIVPTIILLIIVSFIYIFVKPSIKVNVIRSVKKKILIRNIIAKIWNTIVLFLGLFIFTGTKWILDTFGTITADKFMFQIRVPLKGTDQNIINSFISNCVIPSIVITMVVFLLIRYTKGEKYQLQLQIKEKKRNILVVPSRMAKIRLSLIPSIFLFLSIFYFSVSLDMYRYFKNINTSSPFIENNYVDPREITLTFPDKKRNLIFIFMESMEATYFSRDLGGFESKNLTPELSKLAENYTSFSNTEKLGGALYTPYASWTMAGMVSAHTGIPLKIEGLGIEGNSYGLYESFLPRAYSLGDVLKDEGYNQVLLVGSDATFGGRSNFFSQHGDYEILDLYTAENDGIIPTGYHVFWGYEDIKLYQYAKKALLDLASEDKPFNLTMLTVDTHFESGYICELCRNEFDEPYNNVIACASRQVDNFISWVQKQDFYENTTIVITGDHINMSSIISKRVAGSNYTRTTFNAFINSVAETENDKNRLFYIYDIFPTTLASMGVSIDGNRLGLGTNLFSDVPTLIELYGEDTVIMGVSLQSNFYNSLLYKNK